MVKIAILITGEIRIKDFNNLYNSINKFDIFISTYNDCYEKAKLLTDNIITISRDDKCLNKKTIPYKNIYQWWHLDKLLRNYKERLQYYDILFKTRTDCYFLEPVTENHFSNIDMNSFYMNSDHSFYGNTIIFYKIYENYYNEILTYYINEGGTKYFPINYINLVESYKNTRKLKYNKFGRGKYKCIRQNIDGGINLQVYPKHIYHKNINNLIKNIEKYIIPKSIKNFDNQGYIKPPSGNPNFGSEKYNFLHVVNKVVIKNFELPTVGIIP